MMSEQPLVVDGDQILAVAAPLTPSGSGLPQNVPLDFSGSCSSTVTAAAESFAMYISVHVALAGGAMVEAGRAASDIVTAWEQTDAQLNPGGEG
ncbi:hypothetical protein A4X17_07825 [Plantibacter sp. H53]|nr:hypothetical protein BWO91_05290 [Plantibacter flavus]OAN27697.1 hypothetical protein A4X17_07825 [Plantibacter sp. H53]OII43028.1 hypothetical protein BIU99_14200 [Plantibacter sp. MMLR14_011]